MTETPIHDDRNTTTNACEAAVLTSSAIGTVLVLGWILWFSHYGIDFTDESFYLIWISNPFNYSVSASQFGFIYYPLYKLLGGDITALRQANILITFILAWVLCSIFLKTVFKTHALHAGHRLVISAAFATSSLMSLASWLPTPSYNSLALQALLIAAVGLLLAEKRLSRACLTGWLLIGVGGWLAFMAKPTTAAALALCAAVYLIFAKKLSFRLLAISLATALGLLVISALSIDGSIHGFIDRLKGGFEVSKLLGAGHASIQLLRLDNFWLPRKTRFLLIAGTGLAAAVVYLSQAQRQRLVYGGGLLSISFVCFEVAIIWGLPIKLLDANPFQNLLIWIVPFAAILFCISADRISDRFQIANLQPALMLGFLALPYVYAFGTSNNYWSVAANAGIFWALAGLLVFGPIARSRKLPTLLLPLGIVAQLVTAALVGAAIEEPYRQPHSLRQNSYELEIGTPGSALLVSRSFGEYFSEAIDKASQAGFKKGTPMIDLTGQFPGTLYAVGANVIGQAWTIGSYTGSNALAEAMLQKVPCEQLATTWLLVEPESPGKISPDILASFGANMATDFEIVGTLKTAEGTVGHKTAHDQQFLKPIRSVDVATAACEVKRTESK